MNRRISIILSLTSFSSILTVYAIFAISRIPTSVTYGPVYTNVLMNGQMQASLIYPSVSIPLISSIVGWLLTGYEIFAERRKEISHILRTRVSGKSDHWNIYRVFKGKGGARRLTILESLDVPRQRNEVAKMTNTDWKEVDRNMRILESANLVRSKTPKASYPSYELTEQGHELLEKIAPIIES